MVTAQNFYADTNQCTIPHVVAYYCTSKERQTVGAHPGLQESLCEEHDLADLQEVRNDDNDGSEKRFDGFRELGASRVAWVHCDEDTDPVIQKDLVFFELKMHPERFLQNFLSSQNLPCDNQTENLSLCL